MSLNGEYSNFCIICIVSIHYIYFVFQAGFNSIGDWYEEAWNAYKAAEKAG